MIKEKQLEILIRTNWLRAADDLKFRIITPFNFEISTESYFAFAYLPDFGSANGTVVGLTGPPNFDIEESIIEWAKINSCHYSFINYENFINYDIGIYTELLDDWKIS